MRVQGRVLTALVVEDEALVRCDIAGLLRDEHWQVLESAGGEGAIHLLPNHHIDLVFTDIQLAGLLTGWDVAEEARRSQPLIHVIYTSGNAMEPLRRVKRSLFFAKPYAAEAIVVACATLTGGKRTPS